MGNENKKEQKEDRTTTMPKTTDKPPKQSLRSNVIVSGLNSQNQLGYAFSTEANTTAQDTTYKPVLLDLDKFDGSMIKAVACYGYHSVFLTEQNRLFSAGANSDSELGVGHNNVVVSPVQPILQNENIVQLACGFYHTLFLTEDGRIFACGRGSDGQLGLGDNANVTVPTLVPLSDRITMIRCGYYHSMAKSASGVVYACGSNSSLECCYHGTSSSFRTADLPEELERDNIADISCSLGHTLILSKDGIVFGSGANNYHQLTSSYDSQNTLQRITTGIKAIHAAAYCSYFIPIDPTKHLLVAGYNGWQQFGDSTIGQQASVVTEVKSWPLHLKMVSGVVSTIALTENDELWVCGGITNDKPRQVDLPNCVRSNNPKLVSLYQGFMLYYPTDTKLRYFMEKMWRQVQNGTLSDVIIN